MASPPSVGAPAAAAASPEAAAAAPSTYQAVHKKVVGTIALSDANLAFHPSSAPPPAAGAPTGSVVVLVVPWTDVTKHQVSPASHPKHLLKILRSETDAAGGKKGGKSLTFVLPTRESLDRIRRDVSSRLGRFRRPATTAAATGSSSGTKRTRSDGDDSSKPVPPLLSTSSFAELDPQSLAVTRASLLASSSSLRAQHDLLVPDTLTEDDFWVTHGQALADEHAKIFGKTRAGSSSVIKSNLDLGPRGRVKLGVEEMRQIFILYPAVHRAYEEKVPLELSEEQFWRKYLESEYFHRDRGRVGGHVGKVNVAERDAKARMEAATGAGGGGAEDKGGGGDEKKEENDDEDEKNARMAVAGTDDIFSRYDAELRKEKNRSDQKRRRERMGVNLAVGQFDLASTMNAERGAKAFDAMDLHPRPEADSKGARVVDKYNRHWAMVLNPEGATAGCDLRTVARRSVEHVLDGDDDAKVRGGVDDEMRRLASFAAADDGRADHVKGLGETEEDRLYEELYLRNADAYSGATLRSSASASNGDAHHPPAGHGTEEARKRNAVFAGAAAAKVRTLVAPLLDPSSSDGGGKGSTTGLLDDPFPPPKVGVQLLAALTKKMAADSKTEADALKMANDLPDDFKKRLGTYFRRSSELLRHFFGLRNVLERESGGSGSGSSGVEGGDDPAMTAKLARIVQGMETVYREMEEVRKELPQTESGETMRKMCLPIMDQLDWAFQLHRDGGRGGGSRGGGGFVTVEEL